LILDFDPGSQRTDPVLWASRSWSPTHQRPRLGEIALLTNPTDHQSQRKFFRTVTPFTQALIE
jgi:hypothetical protein